MIFGGKPVLRFFRISFPFHLRFPVEAAAKSSAASGFCGISPAKAVRRPGSFSRGFGNQILDRFPGIIGFSAPAAACFLRITEFPFRKNRVFFETRFFHSGNCLITRDHPLFHFGKRLFQKKPGISAPEKG
jgi:hypothetical protein